jgi:hypothetical protein
MVSPRNATLPDDARTSPRTALPMVDLPEPDSPTSATVYPAAMSKLTSSTASVADRERRRASKETDSCLIESSGVAAASSVTTDEQLPDTIAMEAARDVHLIDGD